MARRYRGYPTAIAGLLLFGVLAAGPWVRGGTESLPWVHAANTAAPVTLPGGPAPLPEVTLAATATPRDPGDAPASPPSADSTHMAALVAGEDDRLRVLLHHAHRVQGPAVVPIPGSVATLLLPARPSPYTISDLQDAGAVTPLSNGNGFLLVDAVFVAPKATLTLGGKTMSTLLMDSSVKGFTSLVTWGGTLTLAGDSVTPLTITGWDHVNNRAATSTDYGRPYIRSVGGRLDLKNVRVSSLGFWSGRTGGVAWTGINKAAATGGAIASTFTGDTYGAFVSRGDHVNFTDDLFEANQLDGLRLHRGASNSSVTGSAAVRNGINGFVVSRGAMTNMLRGDLAIHNAGNGFLLNGQPLVNGASPSGNQAVATSGTILVGGEARDNLRAGIIVEGGAQTVIQDNIVCSATTGIAVRAGATNTYVTGNNIGCGGRTGLSIGPGVTGTTVTGNSIDQQRIGILIRNSPGVRLIANRLTGLSVFGISVRGASPGVVGNSNVIAGLGLQPIDTRAGAPSISINDTDIRGWQHRTQLTVLGYLRYHPILTTWLAILALVAFWWSVAHLRRRPATPYKHTVRWQGHETGEVHRPVHQLSLISMVPADTGDGVALANPDHDGKAVHREMAAANGPSR